MTSEEWDAAERRIVKFWTSGDVKNAIEEIETVLLADSGEFKGRALIYRGSINEDGDRLDAARDDFAHAVTLLSHGSYIRYTAELSVARIYRLLGDRPASAEWYRAALRSCEDSRELFSGSTAVEGLLSVRTALSDAERDLAEKVITTSWKVLGIPGLPNEGNMTATIAILKAHEGK